MTTLKNKILENIKMQDELNRSTCGDNWKKGLCDNDRFTTYHFAIVAETVEALDSLNWKHWKDIDAEDDLDNYFLEVVDVYHFLLTRIILDDEIEESVDKLIEEHVEIKDLDLKFNSYPDALLIGIVEDMTNQFIENNIHAFVKLLNIGNITLEAVVRFYNFKHTLNHFRQVYGYQDGSYIKDWFGHEDNSYIVDWFKEGLPVDELFGKLEDTYQKVLKGNS